MLKRRLEVKRKDFQLRRKFVISRSSKMVASTIQVDIRLGDYIGRGESVPYSRYGESTEKAVSEVESIRNEIQSGMSNLELQSLLPAGSARAAVDAALWDLEAKRLQKPVWELAGLPKPTPKETAVTLSLDTPQAMAEAATQVNGTILKLKLGAEDDLERVGHVHEARPDAKLILDGNEGLSQSSFQAIAHMAKAFNVVIIEQPFPESDDDSLVANEYDVAICADESIHTASDVDELVGRYDFVNIKLGKSGGLTEAIRMIEKARSVDMGVMIGCMVSSSLSMAPAMILSPLADYIDLDGPLWLQNDLPHGLVYKGALIEPPIPKLWG